MKLDGFEAVPSGFGAGAWASRIPGRARDRRGNPFARGGDRRAGSVCEHFETEPDGVTVVVSGSAGACEPERLTAGPEGWSHASSEAVETLQHGRSL